MLRNYVNGAPLLTLATAVNAGDLVLEVDSTAGFPAVPFVLVLERATVNEEACLCTAKSANTFTVTRGWDDTTAKSHGVGAAIEHSTAAIEYREANEHTNSTGTLAAADVHTQYLRKDAYTSKGRIIIGTGAGTFAALAVGSNDQVLVADSAQASGVKWSTVSATGLGTDSITTAKLADAAVTTAKLADGSVTEPKLASNAVTAVKIASNAVTTAKILNANVTQAKLANLSVGTAQLIDANVTNAKLGSSSVSTAKIADGAVTEAKIGVAAITSSGLATGAVTNSKIGTNAVTNAKISTGAVTEDKLAVAVLSGSWIGFSVVEPGWSNSSFGNLSLRYKKVGNIGYLVGTVRRTGDSGNGLPLVTLPPGFRPPSSTWAPTFRDFSDNGWVAISSGGLVSCNAATNDEVNINMIFPIA